MRPPVQAHSVHSIVSRLSPLQQVAHETCIAESERLIMPLSELDKQQVGAFMGALLRGEAQLGWSAMPMIKLYGAAQQEHVDLFDMLVRDPQTMNLFVASMKKRARELPASVVKQLEQVIVSAKS